MGPIAIIETAAAATALDFARAPGPDDTTPDKQVGGLRYLDGYFHLASRHDGRCSHEKQEVHHANGNQNVHENVGRSNARDAFYDVFHIYGLAE